MSSERNGDHSGQYRTPADQHKTRSKCCDTGGKGCSLFNPTLLYGMSYFGATGLFLLTCNLSIFYDLQFPTTGSLLEQKHTHPSNTRIVALIIMWGIHFARRFGEVLFCVTFEKGGDDDKHWPSIKLALFSSFYYFFFGMWIGWSVNIHHGYLTPQNYLFVVGIIVYTAGEFINLGSHMLDKPPPINIKYFWQESLPWLGYALASFTLATWIFFLSKASMIIVAWIWQKWLTNQLSTCNLLKW